MGISIKDNDIDQIKELLDLKNREAIKFSFKTVFALALGVAGVAIMLLLGPGYLAIGIGILFISAFAIYQNMSHCQLSRNNYLRAAQAIRDLPQ